MCIRWETAIGVVYINAQIFYSYLSIQFLTALCYFTWMYGKEMVLGLKVLSLSPIPISFFPFHFAHFKLRCVCVCEFSPMDNLFAMNISGCVLTVIPIRLIHTEHKPLNLFSVFMYFSVHM